jgi:4-hydroxybenzoate polyprenyltransferase
MVDGTHPDWAAVAAATAAFGLASSACYVVNDLRDRAADQAHPRKRKRPIASGAVSPRVAGIFAATLALAAAAIVALLPAEGRLWVGVALGAYVANVLLYSLVFKQHVILDVISLSLGFVLRVLGGCAAATVIPSAWLLNCTFFLAMFLAFGKRLGERRTMLAAGADATSARAVQSIYTDELLRMVVVVTAVATLITYAGYVQAREAAMPGQLNLLWLTMLPATYGVFRSMVLLELGRYDDPTELAAGDRPFQLAALLFGFITVAVFAYMHSRAPVL